MSRARRPGARRALTAVALALVVLGTTLTGALPGLAAGAVASTDLAATSGEAAPATAAAERPAALGAAPAHDHHLLAVRRPGTHLAHWRVGLVGVLVTALALLALRAVNALPGRRARGLRPGRGRLAPARAPPAAVAA